AIALVLLRSWNIEKDHAMAVLVSRRHADYQPKLVHHLRGRNPGRPDPDDRIGRPAGRVALTSTQRSLRHRRGGTWYGEPGAALTAT
ncbi:hypothetical protein ABGB17_38830, partial [Sphaerisporangium sp. B11E5]|uniref:hypothetical protein n=1 Tax=Sphaerisporangium sp. B11E5 TaxID=3153563 RepID=UPI00325D80A8